MNLAGAVMLATIAGCATAPPTPQLRAPAGESLPIAARVAIEIDRSVPSSSTSEYNGYVWSYPQARLMQQAALHVFDRAFTEVGPAWSLQQPTVTLRITGSSSINPLFAEYYGVATVTAFTGSATFGRPVAEYRGEGKASRIIYSIDGVRAAFEAAFTDVANRMLADGGFLERVRAQPSH